MSVDASPPQQPPQVSPDGKWVWNGTEWQPVGTHQSVFPSWNSIRVETVPTAVAPVATPVQQSAATLVYPVAYGAAGVAAPPLWQPKSSGLNRYLYWAAGLVALLIVIGAVAAMASSLPLPWVGSSHVAPYQGGPQLLATRSDYARSDRFVNTSLQPAVNDLDATLPVLRLTCVGLLTEGCGNALGATEAKVKLARSAIDGQDVPACIAAQVTKVRADLAISDSALQMALKGFNDNSKTEANTGVTYAIRGSAPIAADTKAVAAGQRACDTQVTGP